MTVHSIYWLEVTSKNNEKRDKVYGHILKFSNTLFQAFGISMSTC